MVTLGEKLEKADRELTSAYRAAVSTSSPPTAAAVAGPAVAGGAVARRGAGEGGTRAAARRIVLDVLIFSQFVFLHSFAPGRICAIFQVVLSSWQIERFLH